MQDRFSWVYCVEIDEAAVCSVSGPGEWYVVRHRKINSKRIVDRVRLLMLLLSNQDNEWMH